MHTSIYNIEKDLGNETFQEFAKKVGRLVDKDTVTNQHLSPRAGVKLGPEKVQGWKVPSDVVLSISVRE